MAKFTLIGYGQDHASKTGKQSIVLQLDPKARSTMFDHDFQKGIYVFKSKHGYVVMAPMRDEYEFSKSPVDIKP